MNYVTFIVTTDVFNVPGGRIIGKTRAGGKAQLVASEGQWSLVMAGEDMGWVPNEAILEGRTQRTSDTSMLLHRWLIEHNNKHGGNDK